MENLTRRHRMLSRARARLIHVVLWASAISGAFACDPPHAAFGKATARAGKIEAMLQRDRELARLPLEVREAEDDRLVLEGGVDTLSQRQRAVSLARLVAGAAVEDRIELRGLPRSDAALESQLRRALWITPELGGIDARVIHRVAILNGRVARTEQAALASRIAASVPGIVGVANHVRPAEPPVVRATRAPTSGSIPATIELGAAPAGACESSPC